MVKIESIAFDLEGTVIDVESAHHQAHILAAADIGLTLLWEDCFKLFPHFIGGPDEEVSKEISRLAFQQGIIIDINYLLKQKRFHYSRLLSKLKIKPREGFIDFFQTVKAKGIKCTIGSLTDEGQAKILLERSGLGKLFGKENIVLREDVQKVKPAPDVWIETAKRAGVSPENQLIFEDSPRGIEGAVKIGAYCIGMPIIQRPEVIKALIRAGAKRIFMHWNEINANNLIDDIIQERSPS